MREIKFRGLNKAGVWVYGDLIQTKPNKVDGDFTCWIKERGFLGLGAVSTPTAAFVEVETKTVGQLLGVKDNSGTELYEGDIAYIAGFGNGVAQFSAYDGVLFKDTKEHTRELWSILSEGDMGNVIGNIHQNPELLEQNDE